MTRRRFIRMIVSAAALLPAGARALLARMPPGGFRRAVAARAFPGRLRPLDTTRLRQPGPWAG